MSFLKPYSAKNKSNSIVVFQKNFKNAIAIVRNRIAALEAAGGSQEAIDDLQTQLDALQAQVDALGNPLLSVANITVSSGTVAILADLTNIVATGGGGDMELADDDIGKEYTIVNNGGSAKDVNVPAGHTWLVGGTSTSAPQSLASGAAFRIVKTLATTWTLIAY